jgi:hypothetical protein
MVGMGVTRFPVWMVVVTPFTITIVWLLLKRVLPQLIRDATEGAGFNIAYLVFFICATTTLWNA